jgi:hypothetical protein
MRSLRRCDFSITHTLARWTKAGRLEFGHYPLNCIGLKRPKAAPDNYCGRLAARPADTIPGSNVGRGPALGRRVWQWTLKSNRVYGQVSIVRLMNANLCRSNFQFFFGKLLGFGNITIAGLSYDHHGRGFLVERTRTRKHQV